MRFVVYDFAVRYSAFVSGHLISCWMHIKSSSTSYIKF